MKALFKVSYTLVHQHNQELNVRSSVKVVTDSYDCRGAARVAEKHVLKERGNGVFDFTCDGIEQLSEVDVVGR